MRLRTTSARYSGGYCIEHFPDKHAPSSHFLSAVSFDYARFGQKFHRIFPGVFLLDELWALAPFLIAERLGFGPTLAATAALLYVPFAERTLVRMAYRQARVAQPGTGAT